ncbi:MAG: hypothetical protein GF329_01855 [Candidatus Lokiarchaeota archaeon]|nr:hypothetical protein [Candidatus Lokiarchaeota archaeon]
MVKIQLIGPLKEQVGLEEIEYNHQGTIREILEIFINDYKDKIKKFIDPNTGFLLKYVMIIVNRTNVIFLKDKLDTYLKMDDKIILALPVGGG